MKDERTRWPVWALVREARRGAGLTQAELARRAKTSQPAIARYERGRALPDLPTLDRIARACGKHLHLAMVDTDPQREANELATRERGIEDRLRANEAHAATVSALRGG